MIRYIFCLYILISIVQDSYCQTYTPEAEKVYASIIRLELEDAKRQLTKLEKGNTVKAHLSNYIMCCELFISEDGEKYEAYYPYKDKHLSDIYENGDPESPYYLFTQADIYLQWALVEAKFRDFYTVFRDISKAYSMLEENHRRFPRFQPNKKGMGVLMTLVGTIPGNYQWGFELLSGIPGNTDKGKQLIEEALRAEDFIFMDETKAIFGLLQIHVLRDEDKGMYWLEQISVPAEESPLITFLRVNISLNLKQLETAKSQLEAFSPSPGQYDIPQLKYYRAIVAMYSGEYEEASGYFKEFLSDFNGLHSIKSAWLYKAYCHYILGQDKAYRSCLQKCLSEGDDLVDEDKYALSVASKGDLLPVPLLQMKIYFDGGNYDRAWKLLLENETKYNDLEHVKFIAYYKARIYHELSEIPEAIKAYREVLRMPKEEMEHYAANSALQLGNIFEKQGDCRRANLYFRKCISIKAENYDSSLDQKAKTGLLLCKE